MVWSRPAPTLSPDNQDWLLYQAANCLRCVGRLFEALPPAKMSLTRNLVSSELKAARNEFEAWMARQHLDYLQRARLFVHEKEYPKEWISLRAGLAAAEKLINACGYHRRDEELADAKRAILGK